MIVTVTPNTAIDRTLFIPSFEWNRTIRASKAVMGMGGKATDASWILGELGEANRALGFAAGLVGRQMVRMLRQRGCETDFVWVGGETRVNTVVVCEGSSQQSTLVAGGLQVSAEHIDMLRARYEAALDVATCAIIGGSLPEGVEPSLYTTLVQQAGQRGIPIVFDASGPGLKAGLQGRPTVAKPNRDELHQLTGRPVDTLAEVYGAAQDVRFAHPGVSLVITLGEEGALAFFPDDIYLITPPSVEVVSSAGAGDGVLAGLALALSRGENLKEGLRFGFAAAGAVCMTPGTADCRREDVEKLLPTIKITPYIHRVSEN
jgi:1-phosphofructokinase family hexose kinase